MLTMKDWSGSGKSFYDLAKVGSQVDEEIVGHFRDVLPPRTFSSNFLQIGEPHDHVNGKATYGTFEKTGGKWYYRGHCFANETVHKEN